MDSGGDGGGSSDNNDDENADDENEGEMRRKGLWGKAFLLQESGTKRKSYISYHQETEARLR